MSVSVSVTHYWNAPPANQRYVQKVTRTLAAHGERDVWHVQGTIEIRPLYFCDCEYCKGHREGRQQLQVDEQVVACSEKDAIEDAINETCSREGYDSQEAEDNLRWITGPDTKRVSVFGNTIADMK